MDRRSFLGGIIGAAGVAALARVMPQATPMPATVPQVITTTSHGGEVLIWDRELSDVERAQVEAYLTKKYAI